MGIVLNRPSAYTIADLLDHIALKTTPSNRLTSAVYEGGPMHPDRGFVLHSSYQGSPDQNLPHHEYNTSMLINDTVVLTTSTDILETAANHSAPKNILLALGYAGWAAGQLEAEIGQNVWLTFATTDQQVLQHIIFDAPAHRRVQFAMETMGLNLSNLSTIAGHA